MAIVALPIVVTIGAPEIIVTTIVVFGITVTVAVTAVAATAI